MKELLELDNRRRIFEFLQEYPGLHLRELERQLDLDVRALRYHLDFLVEHEAVSSLRQEGYLRYYPRQWDEGYFRERIGAVEKRGLGLLRQRMPLLLILLLLDQSEMSSEELRKEAGIAASTLSYHLKKLSELQLIESKTVGKKKTYWVGDPDAVVQLLMKYRPTKDLIEDFLDLWENIGL
ncbi:MAG: helix-turn-helix domain-containing protein [Candidatus Thermoplasmatota archaeon]|nr:helix-turn-helix domain-containing protein [Candidatus Thermoplasmatota archaeon]